MKTAELSVFLTKLASVGKGVICDPHISWSVSMITDHKGSGDTEYTIKLPSIGASAVVYYFCQYMTACMPW